MVTSMSQDLSVRGNEATVLQYDRTLRCGWIWSKNVMNTGYLAKKKFCNLSFISVVSFLVDFLIFSRESSFL